MSVRHLIITENADTFVSTRLLVGYISGTIAFSKRIRLANFVFQQTIYVLPKLIPLAVVGDVGWLWAWAWFGALPIALGFTLALVQEWLAAKWWLARKTMK